MQDTDATQSETPISVFRYPVRTLVAVFLIAVGILLFAGFIHSWQSHQAREAWIDSVEQAGAQIITAGYGPAGPISRVPVMREFFVRTQLEVFVPNDEVAETVGPLLEIYKELGRVWVHTENVSASSRARLQSHRADVAFNGYTMAKD